MNNIHVTKNEIVIFDSYQVRKKEFNTYLNMLREQHPDNEVLKNRSNYSLKMEWAVHNFLYKINYEPARTQHVNLNYPLNRDEAKWYPYLGVLVWLFIR